ncbi:hypothetical protein SUDANB58_03520 [Streptomyces sp. enrichment culture]|uniref:hypothetical protein n=1 Tax=Streptomyces sp. enrichment culture TaxID=1795815 RepID=UPI003F56CDE6
MRTPVGGEVHVSYSQIYVESHPKGVQPELSEAFAGQGQGLCGASEPGFLWLITGTHTGRIALTVEVHEEEPDLAPEWEDVVEASFCPLSDRTRLVQWAGEAEWDLGLARTGHRVRYCVRGMDEERRGTGPGAGGPATEKYLLQFWPAPPAPARVLRRTSERAAYWHGWARELPPPPTPEERAEAERRAREAQARAAEERRLHRERWEWGGRLPSDALRRVGGNVRGLLRFAPDLVHALDAAGPGAQRAVALLAARRACEVSGLTGTAWVARALTALTEGRPLPPPFDDETRLWETVRDAPDLPDRTVREAVPPERAPYRPPEPAPAPAPATVPGRTPLGGRHLATGPARHVLAVARPVPAPHVPRRISRPHYALPALPAAAGPDPLRAALDAVWAAVGAYGEDYPRLLAEVRAACPGEARD